MTRGKHGNDERGAGVKWTENKTAKTVGDLAALWVLLSAGFRGTRPIFFIPAIMILFGVIPNSAPDRRVL